MTVWISKKLSVIFFKFRFKLLICFYVILTKNRQRKINSQYLYKNSRVILEMKLYHLIGKQIFDNFVLQLQ